MRAEDIRRPLEKPGYEEFHIKENKMNEFKTAKQCPKCERKRFADKGKMNLFDSKYIKESIADGNVIAEHLDIACRECGYIFQELCWNENSL